MQVLASDSDGNLPAGIMSLHPIGAQADLHRAVHAVNDARNLTQALGSNLEWMATALSLPEFGVELRDLVRDAVEVCRQLTALLGGAIGSCREATRSPSGTPATLSVASVIEDVIRRVTARADAASVLLSAEGPEDLQVTADPVLLATVLEVLLVQALEHAPNHGVVHLDFARSGGHAVFGVSMRGAQLTTAELTQLHSLSHFRGIGEDAGEGRLSGILASLSYLLADQGGYIDVDLVDGDEMVLLLVIQAVDGATDEPAKSGTVFAQSSSTERGGAPASGQKRSETMIVKSDRFGAIEVDTADVLSFPTGIVGFPRETEFVLIRKADSQVVGWLQSVHTSYLTLPVVSAHVLAPRYPDVAIEPFAERAGLGSDLEELAVLAVLSAPPGQPATVNLMAPVIVNAVTRVGAQVLLEGTRFTTRELFIIPAQVATEGDTALPSSEVQPAQAATSAAE
ncbi:MAG: flagellar assembly protein FliW [Polyangiaceae bacterium]